MDEELNVLENELRSLILKKKFTEARELINESSLSSPFIDLCKVNLLTNEEKYSEAKALYKTIPQIDKRVSMDDLYYIFSTLKGNKIIRRFDTFQWIADNWEEIKGKADALIKNYTLKAEEMPVFTFWNSGVESAPFIVKYCINQMKEVFGNKLIVLDENNMRYYVDTSLLGNISKWANKADLIRTELLMRYGGTWIDSTVLITEKFKEFRDSTPVFFAAYAPLNKNIGNWLLSIDSAYSHFYSLMYSALSIYLKKYKEFNEYFMFHTFWRSIATIDDEARKYWVESDKIDAHEAIHVWRDGLTTGIDDDILRGRYKDQCVFKLTYKYDEEDVNVDSSLSKLIRLSQGLADADEQVSEPETIEQLKSCDDYISYVKALYKFRKDIVVFVSSKDCHTAYKERNRKYKNMGFDIFDISTDLRFAFRESWLCIIDGGDVKKELNSKDSEVTATYNFLGNECVISSAGYNAYKKGDVPIKITINGDQLAVDGRGMNIVVWDKTGNKMIDSIRFDTLRNNSAYR